MLALIFHSIGSAKQDYEDEVALRWSSPITSAKCFSSEEKTVNEVVTGNREPASPTQPLVFRKTSSSNPSSNDQDLPSPDEDEIAFPTYPKHKSKQEIITWLASMEGCHFEERKIPEYKTIVIDWVTTVTKMPKGYHHYTTLDDGQLVVQHNDDQKVVKYVDAIFEGLQEGLYVRPSAYTDLSTIVHAAQFYRTFDSELQQTYKTDLELGLSLSLAQFERCHGASSEISDTSLEKMTSYIFTGIIRAQHSVEVNEYWLKAKEYWVKRRFNIDRSS